MQEFAQNSFQPFSASENSLIRFKFVKFQKLKLEQFEHPWALMVYCRWQCRSFWCRNVWQHFSEATWHKCQINFTRFRIWWYLHKHQHWSWVHSNHLLGCQLPRAPPLVVQIFGPTCPMLKRWNKLWPLRCANLHNDYKINSYSPHNFALCCPIWFWLRYNLELYNEESPYFTEIFHALPQFWWRSC